MTNIKLIRIFKYMLPVAAFLFCVYLPAQQKPKVAVVLEPAGNAAVNDINKLAARDALEDFLKGTGAYSIVARNNTDKISSSSTYQKENGIYKDEDMMDIGDWLMADYVFASEIFKEDGDVRIIISMMDIKSTEKTTSRGISDGDSSRHIGELIYKLTPRLLESAFPQQAQASANTARPAPQENIETASPAPQENKPAQEQANKNQNSGGGGRSRNPLGTIRDVIEATKDVTTITTTVSNPTEILTGNSGGTSGKVPNTGVVYEISEISEGNRVRIRFDNNSNATYTFNWRVDGSSNLKYTGTYGRNDIVPPSGGIYNLGQYQSTTIFLDRIESNRSHVIGRLVFD